MDPEAWQRTQEAAAGARVAAEQRRRRRHLRRCAGFARWAWLHVHDNGLGANRQRLAFSEGWLRGTRLNTLSLHTCVSEGCKGCKTEMLNAVFSQLYPLCAGRAGHPAGRGWQWNADGGMLQHGASMARLVASTVERRVVQRLLSKSAGQQGGIRGD